MNQGITDEREPLHSSNKTATNKISENEENHPCKETKPLQRNKEPDEICSLRT